MHSIETFSDLEKIQENTDDPSCNIEKVMENSEKEAELVKTKNLN